MLAVSNTSPISNLAFIGHVNLLKLQFGTVWIPEGVAGELAVHPDPAALSAIQRAIRDQWIKIAAAQHSTLLSVLLSSLHRGEAEAGLLAGDLRASRRSEGRHRH
jgi:predicted nucleic acid-binding protein